MNDMKNLQNTIMNRVLTTQQDNKAWKRKEKTILFIYAGAIFFTLLLLFFLQGSQAFSQRLRLPGLEPGSQDLMVYFKMFTVILVFSLIAFGVYFVKSRRLQNRVDLC